MTKVRFTFVDIQGNPLPLMEFKLIVRRASFNIEDVGVTLPEEITVTTDVTGQVIVDLWPLKTAYRIQVAEEYEELCGKLNWSFYVPHTNEIVEAQTLFLVPPPNNLPWDEEAMGKITQAVIDSKDSAEASEASAVRAENAAQSIEGDADRAEAARDAAEASKNAAAGSAQSAANSAAASGQSATDALASKNAAANSANAANNSAVSASNDAGRAAASEAAALASKNAAAGSATAASGSATTATNAANSATASKDAAAASATTASTKAGEASTSAGNALTQANRAKTEADRAVAATDNKQDKNGNLTALAALSGAADRLFYFTSGSAMAVAPFTTKARALLARTDTAGMQAELGLVPITSLTDTTSGRVITPGWMGLGGNGIIISASGAANSIRTSGNYYASGPVGTPENYGFLQHFNITDTDAGQEFLSISTGNKYTRVLSVGTWSAWVPLTNSGAYGIGNNAGNYIPNDDANSITIRNGFYATKSTWAGSLYPGTDGRNQGFIHIESWVDSRYVKQTWTSIYGNINSFVRFTTTGPWSQWVPVYDGNNVTKDPALGRDGGVCSSAVVNGFTISKFVNGQCHVTGPLPSTPSIAAGSYSALTATIPTVLVAANNPVISVQAQPSQVYDSYGVVAGYVHAAASGYITTIGYVVRNGQTAQAFGMRVSIWGTWI
jgi:hypothetical protein